MRAPQLDDVLFVYSLDLSAELPAGATLRADEFLGVKHDQLASLTVKKARISRFKLEKLVALQAVTFRVKKDYNAHCLLRAIDNNTLLSKLDPREVACSDEYMLSSKGMERLFEEAPFLIDNACSILERCQVSLVFGTGKNKTVFFNTTEEDIRHLRELAMKGAVYRYQHCEEHVLSRIDKELEIIVQKDFVAYFLINWDIVTYARTKGFFYVGRGSSANSIIAYCLRITDVDPIDLDLYFERFINLYRENPPDFDIDFSWKDRDEIIAYIFKKYGTEHTSLLATYSTFQVNSVMRSWERFLVCQPPKSRSSLQATQMMASRQGRLRRPALLRPIGPSPKQHAFLAIYEDRPLLRVWGNWFTYMGNI